MIVVDVNVLAFYTMEGKRTADANVLRQMDPEWLVPSFWRMEYQSILWKYVRNGGMQVDTALDLLEKAVNMFSVNEVTPSQETVLRDALNWGITVYDAQYVSLARQLRVRCVTEDVQLQKNCPSVVMSLDEFLRTGGGSVVRESKTSYSTRRRRKSR